MASVSAISFETSRIRLGDRLFDFDTLLS